MKQKKQKTLSIAVFGQRAPGDPLGGGIEVVVTELATRMAALGHKVTCYNRSNNQIKKRNVQRNINAFRRSMFLHSRQKDLQL